MSHDAAKARLGSYTDQDLARDAEVLALRQQLEMTRKALLESKVKRARSFDIRTPTSTWDTLWPILAGLVMWAVFSKGIAW